ncbi:unnamed protein product [Tenebrio molitor]|nr:unnamed protein product [Tenebrio molitor]
MVFSTGTAGLPKAICHSHYTLLMAASQMHQVCRPEVTFHFTTFYWMTAFLTMMLCFKDGTSRVFCRGFFAHEIYKIIEKYKVTTLFTVPILTYTLTNFEHSTRYDTSTVRLVLCDGTSMDPAKIQRINTKFRNAVTCLAYGLTETGLVSMFDIEKDADLASSI